MASRGESIPRSLVMMGGPIDARKSLTAVNSLAMSKSIEWFEANTIHNVPPPHPGAGQRVYTGFLQNLGFIAMNPSNHLQSHWDYFQNLVRGDEQDAQVHIHFYDGYNAVLDMDAHYYLNTIRTVFKDYALPNGTWMVRNEIVKSQDIQGRPC